jgi:hypothetical protein
MKMAFKESESDSVSTEDKKERAEFMRDQMAGEYGVDNVNIDSTGSLRIKVTSPMVAIRDSFAKEWTFVNLRENDPLTDRLFSKTLQAKLATYK